MARPEPGVAPVIPPGFAPIIHEKLLGTLDVNGIFVLVPLHIVDVLSVVTTGAGLTVTITENTAHEPEADEGVTRYSRVPIAVLLGLISV